MACDLRALLRSQRLIASVRTDEECGWAQQKTASEQRFGSRLHSEFFNETVDVRPVDPAVRPI